LNKQIDNGSPFPALNSIGYRQIQAFLNGDMNQDVMKEEIIIKTRQFSRRQVQWFKNESINLIIEMENLDLGKISEILHCIFKIIT
jgi:tRNA A37 N6-isopentenylltransferase MiaA